MSKNCIHVVPVHIKQSAYSGMNPSIHLSCAFSLCMQILPAPGVKLQHPAFLGPKQQFMVMFMCILTVMLKVQLWALEVTTTTQQVPVSMPFTIVHLWCWVLIIIDTLYLRNRIEYLCYNSHFRNVYWLDRILSSLICMTQYPNGCYFFSISSKAWFAIHRKFVLQSICKRFWLVTRNTVTT